MLSFRAQIKINFICMGRDYQFCVGRYLEILRMEHEEVMGWGGKGLQWGMSSTPPFKVAIVSKWTGLYLLEIIYINLSVSVVYWWQCWSFGHFACPAILQDPELWPAWGSSCPFRKFRVHCFQDAGLYNGMERNQGFLCLSPVPQELSACLCWGLGSPLSSGVESRVARAMGGHTCDETHGLHLYSALKMTLGLTLSPSLNTVLWRMKQRREESYKLFIVIVKDPSSSIPWVIALGPLHGPYCSWTPEHFWDLWVLKVETHK